MSGERADIIVIGAGIAGSSVAAELSRDASVILLERETQPGYHTTGRSAAQFTTTYGPPVIRALSRASQPYFQGVEEGAPQGLLAPRGVLFLARPDQGEAYEDLRRELAGAVTEVSGAELADMVPLLREGYAVAGLYEEDSADIDVHGLHQHYLKLFASHGGSLVTRATVEAIGKAGGDWVVETRGARYRAPVVVNAAGAWADELAQLAGVHALGLRPLRRTALTVALPDGVDPEHWPLVVDAEETFYAKPDAGRLLVSPADETLSDPCDAQPEELDIAICIDRLETAFDIQVRRPESAWAGLRSFFPDRCPVFGFDQQAEGFFWLAGQGGYGIQTAPAMARTAAALVRGQPVPEQIAVEGVRAEDLSPGRPGLRGGQLS